MKLKFPSLLVALLTARAALAFDAVLTDDCDLSLSGRPAKTGSLPYLTVDSKHNALLKFDLSTIPPGKTASNVANATLTVFVNRVTTAGSVSLARVMGDWDEGSIPAVSFTNLGGQVAVIFGTAKGNFVRFDVTDLVKGWLSGTINNDGIAVKADTSGNGVMIALDSKENTATGHSAQLQINFVDQPAIIQSFRGLWSGASNYAIGDIISFGGSTYIALSTNSNLQPDSNPAAWTVFAQNGTQGVKGDTGDTGPQGLKGDKGDNGNTGMQGLKGDKGDMGSAGSQGVKGDKGDTGATGSQGPTGLGYNPQQIGMLKWAPTTVATFTVGQGPSALCFDGACIWVANSGNQTVTKMSASDGKILGTYSAGGASIGIAFDGRCI